MKTITLTRPGRASFAYSYVSLTDDHAERRARKRLLIERPDEVASAWTASEPVRYRRPAEMTVVDLAEPEAA